MLSVGQCHMFVYVIKWALFCKLSTLTEVGKMNAHRCLEYIGATLAFLS